MSVYAILALALACLFISVTATATVNLLPSSHPLSDSVIPQVTVTLYLDSNCTVEAEDPTKLSVVDSNDRCGACIDNPTTSPPSSVTLVCAQTTSDTQLKVTLWQNNEDCSGAPNVTIVGNAHSDNPTSPASSLCMPVTIQVLSLNLTLSYYAITDCGDNAPVPAAQPQCSVSAEQRWIFIGAFVGAGVLFILFIATCCYCVRKRSIQRQQALLAHSNAGLSRGISIERPTINHYQAQSGYGVPQQQQQIPVSQATPYVRMQ